MNEHGGPSDEVVRSFIALEISDEVRNSLAAQVERLRRAGAKVSWVPPQNMHLSLAFLGNIFASLVGPLGEALDRVARETERFSFTVSGIGSFGSKKKPRVIWAGIDDPPPALAALQGRVAEGVRDLGVPLEKRPFRAHITLGRVRSSKNVDALTSALGSANNTVHGSVDVRRLLLMRSQLDPQGARYSILHESLLKGEEHHGR